jgi:hypothetical protein
MGNKCIIGGGMLYRRSGIIVVGFSSSERRVSQADDGVPGPTSRLRI